MKNRKWHLRLLEALVNALGPLWVAYCDWRFRRAAAKRIDANERNAGRRPGGKRRSRDQDLGIDALESRFYTADFADYSDDSMLGAAVKASKPLTEREKAIRAAELAFRTANRTGKIPRYEWDAAIDDYRLDGIPASEYPG